MSDYLKKLFADVGRPHRLSDDALMRRRCRAAELHKEGLNYVQIGERLGIHPTTAKDDVSIVLYGAKHKPKGETNGPK
jgi:DNA-binding CsgD family transcriptional regulator